MALGSSRNSYGTGPALTALRRFAALILTVFAGAAAAQTVKGPILGTPTLSRGVLNQIPEGYVAEEYFISGTARSYVETSALTSDGRWQVRPSASAPYTTRVVVLRPISAKRFNGTVVVEWLNVSGGADASASWSYLHRELARSGYAYVGVSVQRSGIDGGAADAEAMRAFVERQAPAGARPEAGPPQALQRAFTGKGLKAADPERYKGLDHPGDAFTYDIFSLAGRAVREGKILGPLKPKKLLATGASQSAAYLVTYVNAVDRLARVYDGYLLQVRKKTSAPIDGAVFAALRAGTGPFALDHVRIREDVRVPVLTYISEQDLMAPGLGYLAARQPDTARIRTWEVAGTAHGDQYGLAVAAIDTGKAPIADIARAYAAADTLGGQKLDRPINAAPQGHYILQAGLEALRKWVTNGKSPPVAPRLQTRSAPELALVADEHGNTLGGVRSPWVDVPIAKYAGIGDPGNIALAMMGSTESFEAARLAALYPGGRAEYLRRFEAALDRSIAGGFVLPADRSEILALAAAMYPTSAVEIGLRRIVTGENMAGNSVLVADERIGPVSLAGIKLYPLWGVPALPVALPTTGMESPENARGLGIVRTAVGVLPPRSQVGGENQGHLKFDKDGFHKTESVDVAYVVRGKVVLRVPGEPDILVDEGETIVQNGALHAWRNDTDEETVILWVWVKGKRSPAADSASEEGRNG